MNKSYFYMVMRPSGFEGNLSWFTVHPKRSDAMREARRLAKELEDWKVIYLNAHSEKDYWDYEGNKTIVVVQTDHYYHGS